MCTVFTIRRNASLLLKGPAHTPHQNPKPLSSRVSHLRLFADIDALAQIPEEIEVIRELLDNPDDNTQVPPHAAAARRACLSPIHTRALVASHDSRCVRAGSNASQSSQVPDQSQLPR
jgi:hypothetical protein